MTSEFLEPHTHLTGVDARSVGAFIASASDVALVVDGEGIVRDAASEISQPGFDVMGWLGQPIQDLVTIECKEKVEKLLSAARSGQSSIPREINHNVADGIFLPVKYTAVPTGNDGNVVLMGRDLSPVAELQQRLVVAQQSMERRYEEQRQSEARYRMVFQTVAEGFVIFDGASGKIREFNQRAAELLEQDQGSAIGRKVARLFAPDDRGMIEKALSRATLGGDPVTLQSSSAASGLALDLEIIAIRSRSGDLGLVRLLSANQNEAVSNQEANLVQLLRLASEAVVLIGEDGRVIWTNESFVELTHSGSSERVNGREISEFFDGPSVNVDVMLTNAQHHGRLHMIPATVIGSDGLKTDVELSIVAMPDSRPARLGLVMRNVSLRVVPSSRNGRDQHRTTEQLTELIGKVPLKDLVRDSTDLIERNCIEAALKLTGHNRALAAKVLGLSRQSLYSKLRRFGLIDSED